MIEELARFEILMIAVGIVAIGMAIALDRIISRR